MHIALEVACIQFPGACEVSHFSLYEICADDGDGMYNDTSGVWMPESPNSYGLSDISMYFWMVAPEKKLTRGSKSEAK